jgi:hypothetical protein
MQMDSTTVPPLVTGPFDAVRYVDSCQWKRSFSRSEWSHVYVVAHRGSQKKDDTQPDAWIHVYRIVDDSRTRRPLVYLEAVLNGDSVVDGLHKAHQLVATFGQSARPARSCLRSGAIDEAA